ncbi:MAG: metallophosphoesterase [Candidatus Thorarchaeota archaeon]|nr:metallophosphoesterase [Candidatus Thorarchaeota archaeon]
MVKIAHISDSHLGAAAFQLTERKEDMRACFQQAIEKALEHKPDILVHTGDLFDSPEPAPEDMQIAIEMFKKVRDARVHAFIVQGNHDLPGKRWDVSPVVALERAGLAITTIEDQHREFRLQINGEQIEVHLVSWGYERTTRGIIDRIRPKGDINLLFTHTLPIKWDEAPIDFDYIGEGHKHDFRLDEDAGIGRPGSTAIVEWRRELGYGRTRGVIVVDVTTNGNKYVTEPLEDVREFNLISGVDITGRSGEDANQYLRDVIKRIRFTSNGGIAVVQVNGIIDSETSAAIKPEELVEYGEQEHNSLLIVIDAKWQVLGTRPIKITRPLDVKRAVREYVEQSQLGSPDEFLEILEEIM